VEEGEMESMSKCDVVCADKPQDFPLLVGETR